MRRFYGFKVVIFDTFECGAGVTWLGIPLKEGIPVPSVSGLISMFAQAP